MQERELLAEGREAEIYLQSDGTILKLLRDPAGAARVEREAAACRLLQGHGHVTPAVHGTVTVDGRPGLVMERVGGTDLLSALERRPLRVATAGRVLAEVHAALLACEAPSPLPDLKGELAGRITGADPLPGHLRELALGVLDGLPAGDRLCHGDLHLGNLLGSWSDPVVIDWGSASRGDPLADVARTELLHRVGELPAGTPAAFRALALVGRRLVTDRYLAVLGRLRPIDRPSLDRWRFVQAAARLDDPVPGEHPILLRLLARRAETMAG